MGMHTLSDSFAHYAATASPHLHGVAAKLIPEVPKCSLPINEHALRGSIPADKCYLTSPPQEASSSKELENGFKCTDHYPLARRREMLAATHTPHDIFGQV